MQPRAAAQAAAVPAHVRGSAWRALHARCHHSAGTRLSARVATSCRAHMVSASSSSSSWAALTLCMQATARSAHLQSPAWSVGLSAGRARAHPGTRPQPPPAAPAGLRAARSRAPARARAPWRRWPAPRPRRPRSRCTASRPRTAWLLRGGRAGSRCLAHAAPCGLGGGAAPACSGAGCAWADSVRTARLSRAATGVARSPATSGCRRAILRAALLSRLHALLPAAKQGCSRPGAVGGLHLCRRGVSRHSQQLLQALGRGLLLETPAARGRGAAAQQPALQGQGHAGLRTWVPEKSWQWERPGPCEKSHPPADGLWSREGPASLASEAQQAQQPICCVCPHQWDFWAGIPRRRGRCQCRTREAPMLDGLKSRLTGSRKSLAVAVHSDATGGGGGPAPTRCGPPRRPVDSVPIASFKTGLPAGPGVAAPAWAPARPRGGRSIGQALSQGVRARAGAWTAWTASAYAPTRACRARRC